MSGLISARHTVADDFGAVFSDRYARMRPDELIAILPLERGPATEEKLEAMCDQVVDEVLARPTRAYKNNQ